MAGYQCIRCGGEYHGHKRKYCGEGCAKAAHAEQNKERLQRPEVRAAANARNRQRRANNPEYRAAYKARISTDEYKAKARERRRKARANGGRKAERRREYQRQGKTYRTLEQRRRDDLQRAYNSLANKNARQAWKYWLSVRAPDWWLEQYYSALGKPWLNPRLSTGDRYAARYRHDPEFRLRECVRRQMRKQTGKDRISELMRTAIHRRGESPVVERLVGYTMAELRTHLEKQFQRGMNWDNYGEWHIDHIVPASSFDLAHADQVRACWHLSNLQPLWAADNCRKGALKKYLL